MKTGVSAQEGVLLLSPLREYAKLIQLLPVGQKRDFFQNKIPETSAFFLVPSSKDHLLGPSGHHEFNFLC